MRVFAHPSTFILLREFEELGALSVSVPSANRFGAVSPTTTDAVREELNDFLSTGDLIVDGGLSQIGIASTIIDCTEIPPLVLRNGAITIEMSKITFSLEFFLVETEGVEVTTSGYSITLFT